ncbi:MAG TPA: hypothetical protein VHT52_24595 [Stellaceae bacterium]|jgi:hypothetical protein|nr:hypothetical protein [Stellaceae bacterium]
MLAAYVDDVQSHLNDQQGQFFPIQTLHRFINRSRRRVAAASGCLRWCPKDTWTVPKKEIYRFTDWKPLIQDQMPGTQGILACRSLAVSIGVGGWKPMWRRLVWSDFQARFRIYNGTFYGMITEPGWYSQYGEGEYGSLYLAPIPMQAVPFDVDLTLIPAPLLNDSDPEPIPYPWTDAVSYWAAVLALLQQQRKEDAQAMAQLFNSDMPMCAAVVCPQMLQSPYSATIRSA